MFPPLFGTLDWNMGALESPDFRGPNKLILHHPARREAVHSSAIP